MCFIIFPSTSLVVFKTFACDVDFDLGDGFLRADYSVKCQHIVRRSECDINGDAVVDETEQQAEGCAPEPPGAYRFFWWYALCMVFVYPVGPRPRRSPACVA